MSPCPEHEKRFASWLEEHGGILSRVSRSYARGAADAADLRQEMLYQLWLSVARFQGASKASTWIYRVCLNTALTWRRGARRREDGIESGTDVSQLGSSLAMPSESLAERELMDALFEAIHAMPPAERALVLLMLDGLPYREISEVTGLSENQVGVALTRARKRLATQMKGIIDELQ